MPDPAAGEGICDIPPCSLSAEKAFGRTDTAMWNNPLQIVKRSLIFVFIGIPRALFVVLLLSLYIGLINIGALIGRCDPRDVQLAGKVPNALFQSGAFISRWILRVLGVITTVKGDPSVCLSVFITYHPF